MASRSMRVGDGLPHPHVVPRLAGLVEREVPVVVARRDGQADRVVVLQLRDALRRNRVGPVDLAGLQRRQRRRRFGDEPERHARDLRRATPVRRVGLQRDRVAALLAARRRTGPVPIGWVAIWPLSTLRRDTIAMPLKPPRLVSRFGVGCLTRMTTVVGSGAANVGDGAELVDVGQLLVDDAAIRVHDVVGGERAAVVKGDAAAQVERPRELVGADVPRLGQCGPHLEVRRRVRRACRRRSRAPRTRSRRWSCAGRAGRVRRRSRRSDCPTTHRRGRPVRRLSRRIGTDKSDDGGSDQRRQSSHRHHPESLYPLAAVLETPGGSKG